VSYAPKLVNGNILSHLISNINMFFNFCHAANI